MADMTKRQRIEATFRREPVDRPPVALWRHWPGDDQHADDLARAQLAFQQRYDFDWIKVTPSSSFCAEDWGVSSVYPGNTEGTRSYVGRVISSPDDWRSLRVLDPHEGALGRQVRCLRRIAEGVGDTVPFIQTVFNPLSVAKYLAGDELLLVHLRQCPDAVKQGLEIITDSIIGFVGETLGTGAAGLFYAVQHAQYGLLSESEYRSFGIPYDLRVLEATAGEATHPKAWFNLLHLHGSNVMFSLLADLPVQMINWHDRETPPTLSAAAARTGKALCGGLRQWDTMVRGDVQTIHSEALDAIQQTGGRGFALGTGCVTPIVAPTRNIHAARQAVDRG